VYRKEGRKEGREGGRKGGRKGGREGGMEEGRKGGRCEARKGVKEGKTSGVKTFSELARPFGLCVRMPLWPQSAGTSRIKCGHQLLFPTESAVRLRVTGGP